MKPKRWLRNALLPSIEHDAASAVITRNDLFKQNFSVCPPESLKHPQAGNKGAPPGFPFLTFPGEPMGFYQPAAKLAGTAVPQPCSSLLHSTFEP